MICYSWEHLGVKVYYCMFIAAFSMGKRKKIYKQQLMLSKLWDIFENLHSPYVNKIYFHRSCSYPQIFWILPVDFTGSNLPGTNCENQNPGCLYSKDKIFLLNILQTKLGVCMLVLRKFAIPNLAILLSCNHFSIYMLYYSKLKMQFYFHHRVKFYFKDT